jgi:amino acid adenylation domain-containing protein
MNTTEFLTSLRGLDVDVWADGETLRCNAPKGVLTDPLREQFAQRKEEILAFLHRSSASGEAPIAHVPRDGELPLSFAQQRLWFLDRLQPGSYLYNEPAAVRLRGSLDADVLARSLNELIRRHEILRTTFRESGGRPFQVIAPELHIPLPLVDLSDRDAAEREADVLRCLGEEARHPFDLACSPLLRFLLLRLGEQEHILSLVLHHIVSDGWSTGILMREVAVLYEAFAAGLPSPLPELPVQFADFAAWQRQWLMGEVLEAQLSYWRERLRGAPPVLELPADHARPPVPSSRGRRQAIALPSALTRMLRELARREGATLFSVLNAAYQALLSCYSGQRDVVVGTSIANRSRVETEKLIGFFVNILPIRADLRGDPPFRELLRQVHESVVDAESHKDLPFERLVEELQVQRDTSRTPIFQAFFVLQNFPLQLRLPGLVLDRIEIDTGTAKFDLALDLTETTDGLHGVIEYNADVFAPESVARMAGHFVALLERAAGEPAVRLSELEMLGAPARLPVLDGASAAWEEPLSPAALIAAQAERTPHARALLAGGDELSYGELERRANQLAHCLLRIGAGPDVLVGLCLDRSADMVVGLLGILKAGSACVPLDPEYPEARLTYMLEDAAVPILVTLQSLLFELPAYAAGCEVVCLDSDAPALAAERDDAPSWSCLPESLAYVIYTSGSTGLPKGVCVSHGALGRHLAAATRAFGLGPGDRVLQVASLNFDVSLEQIFGALGSGATLVLRGSETWGPREVTRHVRERQLTVVNLPTALWHQWAAERAGRPREEVGEQLRLVIVGGDAISPEAVRSWQGSLLADVRLLNAYGPTEAVITSTLFEIVRSPEGLRPERVPIGLPIGERSAQVLGRRGEPLPALVPGELTIGSALLARGYLHRPDLTAERFVPDAEGARPGGRRYRTGDLARVRADGDLEFLGRVDQQVKVRGFRIELGEVECALAAHPAVAEAVVVVRTGASGDKVLAAYVVSRDGREPTAHELRAFVREKLPEYMVPASFVVLASMPLTPNGKIDHRALPASEGGVAEGECSAPPRNAEEETLAALWMQVLGRSEVGIHDDFFDLGGHSLLGTQLISRVNEAFACDLPLAALFAAPTIAGLAERVAAAGSAAGKGPAPPITRAERDGPLPPSYAQQRLWFLDQMEPGSPAYSVPSAIRLSGALDAVALERAFGEIIRRHESLRTTFSTVDGMPVQAISDAPPALAFRLVDLSTMPETEREDEVRNLAAPRFQDPFDLTRGPLIRAELLRLALDEHVILVVIHHIVCDDWSVGVILRELAEIYAAFAAGEPSPLPEPVLQYADFACWQRQWLQGEVLEEQLAFWKRQLAGAPAVLELPLDFPRPPVQTSRGAVLSRVLPRDLTDELKAFSQREGVTLYMVLLAGFAALLHACTGRLDLVVGTSIANRNRVELEGLVGFFVNMLVLRTRLDGDPTLLELVGRVRDVALAAYAHQDLPFDRLVEELQIGRDPSRNPLFQVAFTFENTPNKVMRLPGLTLSALDIGVDTSVFDLALVMEEKDGELVAAFRYMTDLFRPSTLEALLCNLETVLRRLVTRPESRLPEIVAEVVESERQQKLHGQKALEAASLAKLERLRRRSVSV